MKWTLSIGIRWRVKEKIEKSENDTAIRESFQSIGLFYRLYSSGSSYSADLAGKTARRAKSQTEGEFFTFISKSVISYLATEIKSHERLVQTYS